MAEQQQAIDLHYTEAGEGKPVGRCTDSRSNHHIWDAQIASLSTDYRVIAPDLRDRREPRPGRWIQLGRVSPRILSRCSSAGARPRSVGRAQHGRLHHVRRAAPLAGTLTRSRCRNPRPPDDGEKKLQRETSADNAMIIASAKLHSR
jgi:hypothetical protein